MRQKNLVALADLRALIYKNKIKKQAQKAIYSGLRKLILFVIREAK